MNAKPWWSDDVEMAKHDALRKQVKEEGDRTKVELAEGHERFRELTMPDWRREELARKYAPEDAYEPDDVEDDE